MKPNILQIITKDISYYLSGIAYAKNTRKHIAVLVNRKTRKSGAADITLIEVVDSHSIPGTQARTEPMQ